MEEEGHDDEELKRKERKKRDMTTKSRRGTEPASSVSSLRPDHWAKPSGCGPAMSLFINSYRCNAHIWYVVICVCDRKLSLIGNFPQPHPGLHHLTSPHTLSHPLTPLIPSHTPTPSHTPHTPSLMKTEGENGVGWGISPASVNKRLSTGPLK